MSTGIGRAHGALAFSADLRRVNSTVASMVFGVGAFLAALVFASAGFRAAYDPSGALVLLAADHARHLSWSQLFATLIPGVPYSPLALLTLLIDQLLWPFLPSGTFALNAAIHAANVALAHRLFSGGKDADARTAMIASAMLAVLPQSLGHLFSVTARAPILSLAFLLLALITQRRCIAGGRRFEHWGSLLLYALALLSCSWAILGLPLVCLRPLAGGERKPLLAAGYVTLVLLYIASVPDGVWRETVLPPSQWSWPRLLLSVLPFPLDMPRADLKYFIMGCWLALYALGLRRAAERMPVVLTGLVWLVPSLLATSLAHPEPIGTNLLCIYIFTPGLALIIANFSANAFDVQDRQLRTVAMLVFAGLAVGYLSLSSILSVRVHFRTNKSERRIDEIRQAVAEAGRPIRTVLAARHTSDPFEYTREAWHYVDLLYRCRSGDPESALTMIGAGDEVWLGSGSTALSAAVKTHFVGHGLVHSESIIAGKLIEDPRTLVLAFDEEQLLVADSASARKSFESAGRRYPVWEGRSLGEWSANDALLSEGEGGLDVECGSTDPSIASPPLAWPAAAVDRFRIELTVLKASPEARAHLYWDSNLLDRFLEANSLAFQFPPTIGRPVAIEVRLSDAFAWCTAGTIERIRLDPGSGAAFRIHSMALLPRGEFQQERTGELKSRWSSGPGYAFELDRAEPSDEPGCFRAVTEDPRAVARIDLDSDEADVLRLTMRCSMAGSGEARMMEAKVYWSTATPSAYDEAHSIGFPVLPDNQTRTYDVRLAHNYEWLSADRITSMRIDPFAASGEFCIEGLEVLGYERLPEPQ